MALLGTNVHNIGAQSIALASGGAAASWYSSVQHSLQTTPDYVLPITRSISGSANEHVVFGALGGTASYATVFNRVNSVASWPTASYDLFAVYVWSGAR